MLKNINKDNSFLILGCPKTGSSLLCYILDTHPEICCRNEPECYKEFIEDTLISNKKLHGFKIMSLHHDFNSLSQSKFKIIWTERNSFDVIHSFYKNNLEEKYSNIAKSFNNKSTIFSYLMGNEENMFHKYEDNQEKDQLVKITLFYKYFAKLKDHLNNLGYEIYTKSHEKIIFDTELETNRLCDFLGVKWHENLTRHHLCEKTLKDEVCRNDSIGHPSYKIHSNAVGQGILLLKNWQIDLINEVLEV